MELRARARRDQVRATDGPLRSIGVRGFRRNSFEQRRADSAFWRDVRGTGTCPANDPERALCALRQP